MKYRILNYDQATKTALIQVADCEENLEGSQVLSMSIVAVTDLEQLESAIAASYVLNLSPSVQGEYSLELEQMLTQFATTQEIVTPIENWDTIRAGLSTISMSDEIDHDGVESGTTGPDLEIV